MKKLIISIIVIFNISTHVYATDAQCKQAFGILLDDLNTYVYALEQKLTTRISLAARNYVSSYEMARSYCRDNPAVIKALLKDSDAVQEIKSTYNIK